MRQKGQKRRLVRLQHRCGHETTEITETFPAGGPGEQKLRQEHLSANCGQCFAGDGLHSEYGEQRPGVFTPEALARKGFGIADAFGQPIKRRYCFINRAIGGAE